MHSPKAEAPIAMDTGRRAGRTVGMESGIPNNSGQGEAIQMRFKKIQTKK